MATAANELAHCEVELVTDPIGDDDSARVVARLPGWQGFRGSPTADGIPRGSRSRFVLSSDDLDAGGLDARVDTLTHYGIAVHRALGEHPAVLVVNRRLGYT